MEHRTGFEPVSQRWQRCVLTQLDQRCFGRGGQSRTVTTSAQDSDACVTPHPEFLVIENEGERLGEELKVRLFSPSHKPLV